MVIRLAHYQGLLSQESLNRFQYKAANYWLRMDRRIAVRDIEDTLQRETWYLLPARYEELFLAGEIATEMTLEGELVEEEVVTDIDEIDRYFEELDNKRSMSGAELFQYLEPDEEGWV